MAWNFRRPPDNEDSRALKRVEIPILASDVDWAVHVVRTIAEFEALEADWKGLYEQSAPRNVFLSYAWTVACWMTQPRDAQLFIVTLSVGGRLMAVAPLCIENQRGFRVLRFIGDSRSDFLGFLCAADMPGLEQVLLSRLLEEKVAWDLILLQQLTPTYSSLWECRFPDEYRRQAAQWSAAPYCASDEDWETLHISGPSWLKITRKRLRRFLKDGWQMERFTGPEAVARLDAVSQIESRSWKGLEGITRLQPGPGQELLRRGFEDLRDVDKMQLWLASLDGRPVAFQIDFLFRDRLWVYQQAFDQDYRKSSVGSFLGYVSFEDAWRSGVREYDYLSGEESYKMERTTALRPIYHLAAHRRTLRGWLAYAVLLAPRWKLRNVPAFRAIYDAVQSVKRGCEKRSGA